MPLQKLAARVDFLLFAANHQLTRLFLQKRKDLPLFCLKNDKGAVSDDKNFR